ncbi:unnamed protein product, partial [Hymenolepis diminuta]
MCNLQQEVLSTISPRTPSESSFEGKALWLRILLEVLPNQGR